jgi:VWFA-related protein
MAQRHIWPLIALALLFSSFSQSQSGSVTQSSSSPPPATARPAAQQESQTVYESATVLRAVTRLVVLDVVATDKDGRPVTDLTVDDFKVMEEGKEQKVRAFSFQHPPGSGEPALREVAANLPPNVFSNIPKFSTETALTVLLLDGLNTNLPNQAYARSEMIKYLEKVPDGRPIAIYTLGRSLHLIQDFTTDYSLIRTAAKNLKTQTSPLQDNPAGGPPTEMAPPGAFDSGMIPAAMQQSMEEFEAERTSFQTDLRVRYTLDALNSLARALSGYPGRKNLIWISEGFPISIDPDFTLSAASFNNMRNYAPDIAEAAESLTDAQIAIYPIDARGLVNYSVFSADSTGRDKFGRSLGRGDRMQQAMNTEAAALQSVHGAMEDLAERTGGTAFYNRNDLDAAIRKSIDDGSTYYTLGYYPENKDWNGKFRKIHVKLTREGVRLRYRLGYYAFDPKNASEAVQRRQASIFGEALGLDFPVSTALRFHAGVVQPSERTQNKVLVNFGLDPHAINFEKQSDGLQHAMVDCAVQAYTEKGKLLKTEVSAIRISLTPQSFPKVMKTIVPCQRAIDLTPGNYLLRLGVMDERTTLIGTITAKVTINPPATTAEKTEDTKP